MSFAADHESKSTRHACQSCHDRKARFSHRGVIRADRDHTLCFECFRRERERQRARHLVEGPALRTAPPAFPGSGAISHRQTAHRRVMLAHMERLLAQPGRP